mgnify:FL=1
MKRILLALFFLSSITVFSQKKVMKQFQSSNDEINIYTSGLDNIILENSKSDFIEVILYAESYDEQLIIVDQNKNQTDIKFHFEGTQTREVIFRKFITKRLQRATATVKIPRNKKVFVFGENVDIESKNHENELAIYIENGIVKLDTITSNVNLKLYSGNVFAFVKNTNLDVSSNNGTIKINQEISKNNIKKEDVNFDKNIIISTIKANIFLTTK